MTGGSYDDRKHDYSPVSSYTSGDEDTRHKAVRDRGIRLETAKKGTEALPPRTVAKLEAGPQVAVDLNLAQNSITSPPREAREVAIILVDNSGSNRVIANGLKQRSGALHAACTTFAGDMAFAFLFFSDHCDGQGIFQEANYVMPGPKGEKVLRASIEKIAGASGGDEPEAIECALHRAAEYDFGHVPKEARRLYLVTDQVAHMMGYKGDDRGCPDQRNWRQSLAEVHRVFGSFQMIASGSDKEVFELQKQFIAPERLKYDLVDLATNNINHAERCALVATALEFLIARNRGRQTYETYLMLLFERWLKNPAYGSETVSRAKRQIEDFTQYLEISEAERKALLERVFAGILKVPHLAVLHLVARLFL